MADLKDDTGLRRMISAADIAEGPASDTVRRALTAVRAHLGMEVAYVSEFVGNQTVFRAVDAPGLEAIIKVGDAHSLDDVYCRHILEGRLPELMPDTSAVPFAAAMPITKAVPIGAHMSVPIRMPDGSAYGMFCCLSSEPDKSLNERDLKMMKVFADVAAHEIHRDIEPRKSSPKKQLASKPFWRTASSKSSTSRSAISRRADRSAWNAWRDSRPPPPARPMSGSTRPPRPA